MARGFTAGFETELAAGAIKPRVFYEGDFGAALGDDPLRLWTGETDISWNSETWLGNGWLQGISAIKESPQIRSTGARITLSGVPTELVSLILQNDVEQGARGKIWLAFLDSSDAIIASPHMIFAGDLDTMVLTESIAASSIEIHYESKLAALGRPNIHRYTDQGQKAFYSDDYGFEYTAFLKDWSGYWGRQEVVDDG